MYNLEKLHSDLLGKPTNFSNISCHGAQFANIKNTTGAVLPDQEALQMEKEIAKEENPQEKTSILRRIFGILQKR